MNSLNQILADLARATNTNESSILDLKDINNRIRQLIDAEMGYIASLHDPKELIAREEAFQDLLLRLEEARKGYSKAHPENVAEKDDEAATQEHLRLAKLINPAPYLVSGEEKTFSTPITRAYFGTPIPTDDGISRLAVRLLLIPKTRTYPPGHVFWPGYSWPHSFQQIEYSCSEAFRSDAQWPSWGSGTLYEAYCILDHNLSENPSLTKLAWLWKDLSSSGNMSFPDKVMRLHNNGFFGLPQMAKELSEKNQIVALGKLLHDAKDAMLSGKLYMKEAVHYDAKEILNKLEEQFNNCLSRIDTTNAQGLADALTACYLSCGGAYQHKDASKKIALSSDLKLLEQLDFSHLSKEHLEALDMLYGGDKELNLVYFGIFTWTKKRIKEATNIPPDLTLLLPHGETIQVHAALLAQKSEGILSYLRDPNSICIDLPTIDLSIFNPVDVSILLRAVYNIPRPYGVFESKNNLMCYLYGPNSEGILGQCTPLNGPDALTDLNIFCKDNVLLQAHRIILSRRLGIPVSNELSWTKINSEDARMLLDFIYSKKLDGETVQRVIDAAQILDLPQVLKQMHDLFESEVRSADFDLPSTNRKMSNHWFKRPQVVERANRLRSICYGAPDFFRKLFDPLESKLQEQINNWMAEINDIRLEKMKRNAFRYCNHIFGNLLLAELVGDKLQIERCLKAAQFIFNDSLGIKIHRFVMPRTLSFGGIQFSGRSTLCHNLLKNPTIRVDLSDTNITDYDLESLLNNSYPILTLNLNGCKNLSPAVQKLLNWEIPNAEDLKENTELIQYLAKSRGEKFEAAVNAVFNDIDQ